MPAFSRHDPRILLIPLEHLSSQGVSEPFQRWWIQDAGYPADRVHLLDRAFSLYWQRSRDLAARCTDWPAPRRRNIAVAQDSIAVPPYAQLLNISTWTLYACDLDPATSHAEIVAYLLVQGDRMAQTGEVTEAAVRNAPYWFHRTYAELARFTAATRASIRPDAEAYRALARALPWLRQLAHAQLRPAKAKQRCLPIVGSRLLVPQDLAHEPPRLIADWRSAATAAQQTYRAAWREPDPTAVAHLCDWLRTSGPALVICDGAQSVVWSSVSPLATAQLEAALAGASGAAVRDIESDLRTVASCSRAFHDSLKQPGLLPRVGPELDPGGYVFLHKRFDCIAYDLDEPGMDRRRSPALPYARAMLAARTIHEWAHLAVKAGWVPATSVERENAARTAVASILDEIAASAPDRVRALTAPDLAEVAAHTAGEIGRGLLQILLNRISDFLANLLAQRYLSSVELETYVRHNIRTLRPHYRPSQLWRMMLRYVYEAQYLRLIGVDDPLELLLDSTSAREDLLDSSAVQPARLKHLYEAVSEYCDTFAVDESRFQFPPLRP